MTIEKPIKQETIFKYFSNKQDNVASTNKKSFETANPSASGCKCVICNNKTSEIKFHYGMNNVCRACAVFFQRQMASMRNNTYDVKCVCIGNEKLLNIDLRIICIHCRLFQMVAAGLVHETLTSTLIFKNKKLIEDFKYNRFNFVQKIEGTLCCICDCDLEELK